MEKIIRRHLYEFLENNIIISDKQFGFLSGRSTTLQLLRALDDWTAELDRVNEVDIIYIDFQKAFDSVPHKRLLNTISRYGIRGKTLEWITSFLTERKQRMVVNEIFLEWAPVISGVPQGSVLGPILFLIYINSMGDGITSQMLLYADDAKIYRSVTALGEDEELQNDLNVISKWADGSLMKFNMTKCHTLTLTGRVKLTERNYILDGNTYLNNVQTEKDLGVIVDSRLLFREQITKKTRLANGMVAIIRISFMYLNAEVLTTLYKALVRTHLEYANQCSNPYLKKYKIMIENVQRRATRLVANIQKLSYPERLKALKLPTLEYRRKRGRMIEVFKTLNGMYDAAATEGLFTINERDTRGNPYKILTRKTKTTARQNFFTIAAINDWNSLPEGIKSSENVNIFKARLDKLWASKMYNASFLE